jgi:hypothetical protein
VMRRFLPTFALVVACALTTCAIPSFASQRPSSTKLKSTTLKLKVSPTTIKQHSYIKITATITPAKATGLVIGYWRPGTSGTWRGLGVKPALKNGVATATILVNRPAGTYQGEVVYQGSGTYAKSTSNPVTITIQ